jgi:hypothetical protein
MSRLSWSTSALTASAVLALTLTLALATACSSTPNLTLSVNNKEIAAGGTDFATITAAVMLGDDPAAEGLKVGFTTSAGSFDRTSELLTQEVSTDAAGKATIKLYSAKATGEATVDAQYYDEISGLYANSSVTIKFTSPLPVASTFRLTCDADNIGAMRAPMPDIKVTCNLTAQSAGGKTIPATALDPTFFAEAGSITPKKDYYTGKQVFVYSPKGGSPAPKDVDPDQGLAEPSYDDKNGKKRNPRDGLATIIAVVEGQEAYNDANGNGTWDPGEPFDDAAEPFVDTDDDDSRDPDEKYVDTNGNGQWDIANGKWDAKVKIMAIYKVLWTGKLDNSPKTSRIDRINSTISNGSKLDLTAYALDANMNPLAAFQKNSDYLEWLLTSGGDATSNDPTTPPMDNGRGFSFDMSANTERKRWKIVSNSFTASPFKFTVEDGYPGDTDPATNFTVSVNVYSTPGPSDDGYFLTQVTEKITDKVQGTCD